MKKLLLTVGILVLVLSGVFAIYAVGTKASYNSGIRDSYNSGKQEGYDSGKADGYSLGKQEGYDSGKADGYDLGKPEGYTLGKAEGYEEGIKAGLGHGYTLRDPTYKEATTFLSQDKTSENKYVENTYVCTHFARDVCNNAEARGLRCALVLLSYSDRGHSIIAFNTIDTGLVYFEPQSDEAAKPVVGKRFYQCVEPRPGYYYEPPAYDDTIIDILVIW